MAILIPVTHFEAEGVGHARLAPAASTALTLPTASPTQRAANTVLLQATVADATVTLDGTAASATNGLLLAIAQPEGLLFKGNLSNIRVFSATGTVIVTLLSA